MRAYPTVLSKGAALSTLEMDTTNSACLCSSNVETSRICGFLFKSRDIITTMSHTRSTLLSFWVLPGCEVKLRGMQAGHSLAKRHVAEGVVLDGLPGVPVHSVWDELLADRGAHLYANEAWETRG